MKKIVFLLIIISLFSFITSSFAIMDYSDAEKIPDFKSYLGFWHGHANDRDYTICISDEGGRYGNYVLSITIFYDSSSSTTNYYMTYSQDTNEIYLTYADRIANDILYKLKFDNGKLNLCGLRSGNVIPLSK